MRKSLEAVMSTCVGIVGIQEAKMLRVEAYDRERGWRKDEEET